MTEGPPCWHSNLALDEPGFDARLALYLELHRPAPPGVVRRVAPPDMNSPKVQEEVDESKRNILKLMAIGGLAAVAGGGAVGAALQYIQPPMQGLSSFPRVQLLFADGTPVQLGNIDSHIDPTKTDMYIFQYPLQGEPNVLLNLAGKYGTPPNAKYGPTPQGNYPVAFSVICQHLGCIPPFLSYYPESDVLQGGTWDKNSGAPYMHCICHGSSYNPYAADTANGGGAAILTGPTVLPLPQVLLEADSSGNLFATNEVGPAVKGHFTTLLGGTPGPIPASLSALQVPSSDQRP
ncbi:MAG: Rieske 2Fe-2S domain-containing protein [Euryarchaeota archaeon]|nr:Rieske 2Fe-2S domain-containing protein [Euryarchaeota archaeon]MDE1835802.1 Rieske 2Fe-2S domain-containing protein [Euryarchaeota archaeon]MDE1880724.1 Rieske 2Fe-2S domain-containing protein [Euryarchaeota archaeon]MDE2043993.1 Rieske 2Fe-2S domain-containing protein [Thermoplasmata archaeon]